MQWIEYQQLDRKKLPRWKRTLGFEEKTGEVFVPAAVGGNEHEVFLCALYDGTPVAEAHKHIYVPASWLAKEFPKSKDICAVMTESAKASIANNT